MPIIGNTIYCSLLSIVNEFDKMPKIAKWRIASNRLIFDTLFGDFPISYDYGNFALGHMSEFIYNPNDSIIILSSGLMDTISLYDKGGKFLKNVYFGSSFKKPIKKISLEGLQEQSTSIQWQRQNNYYCRLIYDPWREVYIRTFYRPSENKTDGIIRDDRKELIVREDTSMYYQQSNGVPLNIGKQIRVESPCWYLPTTPVRVLEKGYCEIV